MNAIITAYIVGTAIGCLAFHLLAYRSYRRDIRLLKSPPMTAELRKVA